MGIDRKTAAYAASRIMNDSKTQNELRELVLALVSAYTAARHAGSSALADPRIRDDLTTAVTRGSAVQARITPRPRRFRRALTLLGTLLTATAAIAFWRHHKHGSSIITDAPADGSAEDVETRIHESETAVEGATDESVEELRDRIG